MKQILSILLSLTAMALFAQRGILSQTANKSVFEVFTYNADGKLLGHGYGFFIGPKEEGVAAYSLFSDAYRAEIVDANGSKHAVTRIAGANSSFDLVKFTTDAPAPRVLLLSPQPAEEGWKLGLSAFGKAETTTITKVTPYGNNAYYNITAKNDSKNFGCPLLDDRGRVVAIIQKNVSENATQACAIDARLVDTLKINGAADFLKTDLSNIHIPKQLPPSQEEALSALFMLKSYQREAGTDLLGTALNDYIASWPENADGYIRRATYLAGRGQIADADADMKRAIDKTGSDGNAQAADWTHFQYSRMIGDYAATHPSDTLWTASRALEEAEAACALNPQPVYEQQRALCLFDLKEYAKALEAYNAVNRTPLASPDTWLASAQCLELLGADSQAVMEKLDSCVALLNRPYNKKAAGYIYIHALQAEKVGRLRDAIADYNEYEKALGPKNLKPHFYATRARLHRKAKMYQQALDDLRSAQARSTASEYQAYRIEECSLLLQVGMYDEVIQNATALLRDIETADLYLYLGIAYAEKGDKTRAAENLHKAANMGNEQAKTMKKKYGVN